ncbi:hypothetical protein AVEN_156-1 [Araneus ventricosus]|uniref:STPR domain-containing protein n=1 Tax=Araneus ventricosus TaxID=182803 RepID=A0A4Y2D3V1_ARAVE|nr:hypothetical protein AVEN_156-1 [Araneus ventricosus]
MPKRKRGVTGDAASRQQAIRKRERRVVKTEEERSQRLSAMAQRGRDRRAEETEELRNSRLSTMAQRSQDRRAEETIEQRNSRLSVMAEHAREHRRIQNFYASRTALYPVVEEHNCGEMDNICLKCGGLYFAAEKNARGVYTHCCHNGKIVEQASVYPM